MNMVEIIKHLDKNEIAILRRIANGEEYSYFKTGVTENLYIVEECGYKGALTLNTKIGISKAYKAIESDCDTCEFTTIYEHMYEGIDRATLVKCDLVKDGELLVDKIRKVIRIYDRINDWFTKYNGTKYAHACRRIALEGSDEDLALFEKAVMVLKPNIF